MNKTACNNPGKRCIIREVPSRKETGMAEKNAKRNKISPSPTMLLIRVALALFVIFAVVSTVRLQNNIVEKRRELAEIEANIEIMKARNGELEDIIKSDDISRYMEKLAVEQNGYAYPDEKRYYDTSRD